MLFHNWNTPCRNTHSGRPKRQPPRAACAVFIKLRAAFAVLAHYLLSKGRKAAANNTLGKNLKTKEEP